MDKEHSFTFVDLFAGIGGLRIAFEHCGGECIFSSEWDKFAQQTYQANFGVVPHGDITKVSIKEIPDHDVLLAGFPCQPFSHAGLKGGFTDTRGTLFFDVVRILKAKKPSLALLENVKGLKNHDNGRTFRVLEQSLDRIGYDIFAKVLNASDFGLPQNRERVFIVCLNREKVKSRNFEFPAPPRTKTRVGDILQRRVNKKYVISDKLWSGHKRRLKNHQANGNGFGYRIFTSESTKTSTISARYYKDGSEILIATSGNPRKITPREAARLQGFPETFQIPVSDTQAYKQFGNSVAINVATALAEEMASILQGENS